MRLLYSSADSAVGETVSHSALSELYRHPLPSAGGVWLRTNFVATLDGSTAGGDGRSGSINTPSDQAVFGLHRAHADVVLVGAQTARVEGYRAVDLAGWQCDIRAASGLSDFPVLAIVSRSLNLDPGIVRNGDLRVGPVLVFTISSHPSTALTPFTDAGITVVPVGERDVDLHAVTEHLAAQHLPRVLCEGGSSLHRDLQAAGLVDEMSLTLAPVVVGGSGGRTTAGAWLDRPAAFELERALLADDQSLFLNYRRS